MFVLVAVTAGDDLAPSQKKLVAASEDRSKLEALKERRVAQREEFVKRYKSLVELAAGSIILEDVIEEVPSI